MVLLYEGRASFVVNSLLTCKEYRRTLMSVPLSLSLYLHDYTVVQYATLPLPYYYHASTVPTLVRPSFPFKFPFLSNQLLSYDRATVR